MRKCGIILPIFSLPSNYGIGTFGKEAYKFVDFLEESETGLWQILPIGPTSYGDSPYQSFSTFAGNPYFIDLDLLVEEKLISKEDLKGLDFGDDENDIDYSKLYDNRYKILKKAYTKGKKTLAKELESFKEENKEWIYDYALFMALKDYNNGAPWKEWDKDIKLRTPQGIVKYTALLKDEIDFYMFMQQLFYSQWEKLKAYANDKNIKIVGDIPIYVAEDSADTWANPKYFDFTKVSGCPPDAFSDTGQLWGNPIYNWKELKKQDFKWWIDRIEAALKLFDVIRIDHFRGFESYWAIPYEDETAINGKWEKAPGKELFNKVRETLGEIEVIAEDLGYITKDVRELLEYCKFPGMKVLQFAFDPSGESEYLPHNYNKNVVVYTGTHDNDTIKGWYNSISEEEREFLKAYTGMKDENDNWAFIKTALSSVANIAILQMQDLLNVGEEGRINVPSTLGTNWRWRMSKEDLNTEICNNLLNLNKLYGRNNKKE